MTIREMRKSLGDTQHEFARRYGIPFRTVQNWESGERVPPAYVAEMLEEKVTADLINRRTFELNPSHLKGKKLPEADEYMSAAEWLKDVSEAFGSEVVFALDDALMLEGRYLGRMGEQLIYLYGDDRLAKYRGVVVIGSEVNPSDVLETRGIRHTSFNRTVNDAMANERILDMQGITEGLSEYYFTHGESFEGLSPAPEYQERFERLAEDAVKYYNDEE